MSASAATATAPADDAVAPKKSKKKLIIIIVIALVLLLVAGGGAMFLLKKKAAAASEGDDVEAASHETAAHSTKPDLKHPPIFLPLEPFIVNLADKDADRYAQVGITLEVDNANFADLLKTYMPAIRNGVLLILAHKTSQELLDSQGKEQLAGEIQREAARTMGIEVEDESADDPPKAKAKAKAKRKATKPVEPNPIKKVYFSNFIIQ